MNVSTYMLRAAKMVLGVVLFVLLAIPFSAAHAAVPVWIVGFDSCTDFQTTHEQFQADLHTFLTQEKHLAERAAQLRDIIKAREDVNKLVATVYNELRTQQVALNYGQLRNILQSLGIVAVDEKEGQPTSSEEMCKAAYQVKILVDGQEQCAAVAQEARIISNQDDYIYEESRRRAMDMLFCYLGDWRHFPIADINHPDNCTALGLNEECTDKEVWKALGQLLHNDPNRYSDTDGKKTTQSTGDDQHIYNLCEGMRGLGEKCVQDSARDFIKYSIIDDIARKDRTVIMAPPQTWYTPERCQVISSFLPGSDEFPITPSYNTPYTRKIKSLELFDPTDTTAPLESSFEIIDFYVGSRFGNPTLSKPTTNMTPDEYSAVKEHEAISQAENNFSGLRAKAKNTAWNIINEFTELRKLQYSNSDGLRDATLRIGWQDYEWEEETGAPAHRKKPFLGKYDSLDRPIENPKEPKKVFRNLPCYWGRRCYDGSTAIGSPTGRYFYFDTGLVVSPLSFTKNKVQSAIQAQFDLAQKAFDDEVEGAQPITRGFGSCGASGTLDMLLHEELPAPWEDTGVDLSSAINPLTGEPYTTGSPGQQNPSYRIPDLPNNYFNVIYNDVFQLYHTPFPDVLSRWFRVNVPAYDSIYGLADPLDSPFAGGGPGGGGPHPPNDPPVDDPDRPLPTGCDAYHDDFMEIGAQKGVDGCLLKAIGAAESSCNPNAVSSHGACGLMQILPSTAGVSCDTLKKNPRLSIQLAADYLKTSAGILGGYSSKHGFSIGNGFTQSGSNVTYGGKSYDTGNDDLIASYNAGWGDKCGSPKQGFCPSSDCPNPKTPSWQCNINPGGFSQTQTYVQRVQNYQKQCTS